MTKPTPSCSQCYQMPKVAPLFVLAGVKSQLRDPILTLVCASFVFGTLQTQARADLLYFGTGNAVVELDPSTFNVESFFLVPPSLGNIEGIAAANGLVAVTTPDSVSEYSSNGTLLEQASAPNGGDVSFSGSTLYFGTGNAVVELDPSTFNVESFFLVPPSLGNIEGIAAANGLVAVTTPDSVSEYSSNGTLLEQASAPNGGDVSFSGSTLYFGTGNAVVELDPSTFNVESFFLVPPSLGNIEGIAAANGLVAVTTPDSVSEYSSNGTLLEQASAPNGGDVGFLSEGASVPEPSTAMSFIVGAVGILAFKLRRSSRYRSEAS